MSTVGEEKRLNPRLGISKSLDDFVRVMNELKLPHPRKMAVAVPANLFCGGGATEPSDPAPLDASWAPINVTQPGVPEVTPTWLAEHASSLRVLDVREPDEFRGELGHISNSELAPLHTLATQAETLSREQPIVTVCRSGGRSGKAALTLRSLGFNKVASLRGGMVEWNSLGLPVVLGPSSANVSNRQG